MSRTAIMHFVSSISLLRTESDIAFRAVPILIISDVLSIGHCLSCTSRIRRNRMHPHMPIQANLLIRTVRTMTASVLLTGPLSFSGVIRRVLIRLIAGSIISRGRFSVFIIRGTLVGSVGAIVGLVSF